MGHRDVFHKHAKLLRQRFLFWPRNRLSREQVTSGTRLYGFRLYGMTPAEDRNPFCNG